jgi:predicted ATPase
LLGVILREDLTDGVRLGYPDQALQKSRAAVTLAQRLSHPYSLAYALTFGAVLHCFCRDEVQTQERAAATVALSSEHGFPLWLAMGTILESWAVLCHERGNGEALEQMRHGLAGFEAIGAQLGRTAFLTLLADAFGKAGQPADGLRTLAEALAVAKQTGERFCEAEMHRLRGELTLQLAAKNSGAAARRNSRASTPKSGLPSALHLEAAESFLRAIAVARQQSTRSWELRAAISMAHLLRRQNRASDAHALLAPVYARFTEGFGTSDLRQALSLLGELAHSP